MLCDEPTGALDYNTSKEILKLIETVNQKYGNTIIMVTHNDAIKDMADRVVKLRDGMIRKNYQNEQSRRSIWTGKEDMTYEKSFKKTIPRELKSDLESILVVFILMAMTIGFVSGFLVADGSMLAAYDEGFEKYNIEDGNFRRKRS